MSTKSPLVKYLGIFFILVMGVVHVIEAPDAFKDMPYKGMLFILNGIAALLAAFGIWRGARSWGWTLGLVVAVATIIGYIASRTVGLPGLPAEPDEWLEPLGVVSIVAEAIFSGIALALLLPGRSKTNRFR